MIVIFSFLSMFPSTLIYRSYTLSVASSEKSPNRGKKGSDRSSRIRHGLAYPFPGDLRAKFTWEEANRLSHGELIDNTVVTCSRFDWCHPLSLTPRIHFIGLDQLTAARFKPRILPRIEHPSASYWKCVTLSSQQKPYLGIDCYRRIILKRNCHLYRFDNCHVFYREVSPKGDSS